MITEVKLGMLMAVPPPFPSNRGHRPEELPWHNVYTVTLGINAEDLALATSIATEAMTRCEDEDGRFIGGVVIETHARCVTADEWRGYARHFTQPIEQRGIFYMSGLTYTSFARGVAAGAEESLKHFRSKRDSGDPFFSQPSYIRRRPHVDEEPRAARIVCPVCGAWQEHDPNYIYSLFSGLFEDDNEYILGQKAAARTNPFIAQHCRCLVDSPGVTAHVGLLFLYEGDDGYDELDPVKEVRHNAESQGESHPN